MSPAEKRLKVVIQEIDRITQDVAPKLIKLGHLRNEMQILLAEVEEEPHVKKEP